MDTGINQLIYFGEKENIKKYFFCFRVLTNFKESLLIKEDKVTLTLSLT